jgi:aminomethyltransferase
MTNPIADPPLALRQTPLFALHQKLGAKMVPFAGFEMPLQYQGIIAEHQHTRTKASLFDISHMGQAEIAESSVDALERLVTADIKSMPTGRVRYTLLTNESGGIIDDLVVINGGTHLVLIVNAARRAVDFAHLAAHLPTDSGLKPQEDRALLALQGPAAATVLGRIAPAARLMLFMTSESLKIGTIRCTVCRSGYTGEDGFEISVDAADAADLASLLLEEPEVKPAGLGARDTLRLEAGLCLYGADMDESTTPVEAGLGWTIGRRRREQGGFLGDEVILRQLIDGVARKRVGMILDGKMPARPPAAIVDLDGKAIGRVTSGTFGPSVGRPIAMGYVETAYAQPDTTVAVEVRDKRLTANVIRLPFVPHRYVR